LFPAADLSRLRMTLCWTIGSIRITGITEWFIFHTKLPPSEAEHTFRVLPFSWLQLVLKGFGGACVI
jgi:hypothetical protein